MEKEEIITVENKDNKGNPNHKPAGSPEGGQFTSSPSTGLKSSLLDFIKLKKAVPTVASQKPVQTESVVPSSYTFNDIATKNLKMDSGLNVKHMESCFNTGTDKAKQLICDFFMSTHTKIDRASKSACYSPLWQRIYFQPYDLKIEGKKAGNYELGETFYHEIFHGIDDRYGRLTSNYKLSNGKTLKEVFHNEISDKKYAWSTKLFNQIKDEYNAAVEEEKNKMFTPEQIKNYEDGMVYYKKMLNDLNTEFGKHNSVYDYPSQEAYNKAYENYSTEFNKIRKEWKKLSDTFLPAQQKAIHKYSCLSDFCSFIYRTGTGNKSICGGHPKEYWSQDGGNKAIKEMWAELGSMWARGKTEDLDRMRKYFPETVASFEELVGKLDEIRKGKFIV